LNPRAYYTKLLDTIHAAPHVITSDLRFEDIDSHECYIRGILTLVDGFTLHIAEYVITEPALTRVKYRYHLQNAANQLLCRWDNVPHHPEIASHPHHWHDSQGSIHPSPTMSISAVLEAIVPLILPE